MIALPTLLPVRFRAISVVDVNIIDRTVNMVISVSTDPIVTYLIGSSGSWPSGVPSVVDLNMALFVCRPVSQDLIG